VADLAAALPQPLHVVVDDLVWSHSEHHLYNEAVLAPRFAASCTPAQITTAPAAPLSSFARVVTS
jgi:hypothetical protein